MSQISPPIRILLVCAVAFMAAWMLFLRPKTDAGTPAASAPAPAATTPVDAGGAPAESLAGKAVEQANEATAAQDARAEELAGGVGDNVATPSVTNATTETEPVEAAQSGAPAKPDKQEVAEGGLPLRVLNALGDRKVLVLLFWSPKAADDRAVRKAVGNVDRHGGRVVTQVANIRQIASYQQITRGAQVEQSPTVVVVDRDRMVESLVGYVDRRTIDQAVTDALRASRK